MRTKKSIPELIASGQRHNPAPRLTPEEAAAIDKAWEAKYEADLIRDSARPGKPHRYMIGMILNYLRVHNLNGHMRAASKILGVSRETLIRWQNRPYYDVVELRSALDL